MNIKRIKSYERSDFIACHDGDSVLEVAEHVDAYSLMRTCAFVIYCLKGECQLYRQDNMAEILDLERALKTATTRTRLDFWLTYLKGDHPRPMLKAVEKYFFKVRGDITSYLSIN